MLENLLRSTCAIMFTAALLAAVDCRHCCAGDYFTAANSDAVAVEAEAAVCQPVPCDDGCCNCFRLPNCECPIAPAPCQPCPHVSTVLPYWNVNIFGALQTNMLFNTARPIAPGIPFLLAPNAAEPENTFDLHARSSNLGAVFTGPKIGDYQLGGLALFYLYNDALIVDRYGILPVQAWGELKNEDRRFSAGLQFNVFSPNLPTMLTFSSLLGSGNTGANFVGQVRYERYLRPTDDSQWTIQFALSDPIGTGITSQSPLSSIISGTAPLRVTEDNGWPQLEGRLAYMVGEERQEGLEKKRALELGVSGVGTQLRNALLLAPNVVANVWGLSADARWRINDRWGVVGEAFVGQGLGFLNGGVLQSVNSQSFEAIRTRGGWGEVYCYLTPCVHTHWGAGIDDPLNNDLAGAQVTLNETVFGNVIWDVTKNFRVGFEATWRKTNYVALPDNEGLGFQSQVQWAF